MKKALIFLATIFSITGTVLGQRSESEIALKEYFNDAEFFLAQGFYADALSDFLQVYRRGYSENANINYRIGVCYLNIPGQKSRSIEYFKKAINSVSDKYRESSLNEKNAPIDLFLYLGNAYRVSDSLQKAIAAYNTYKELLPENEEELLVYTNQQIEACNIASEFMSNPYEMYLKNMGPSINDGNENYNAVVSGDGSVLLFMQRLPFYDAVYFSVKENGVWSDPENITPQIISDGNQFVSSVSYDGTLLFLTKEDEFNSDIYQSTYVDGRWTPSQPLSSKINTKFWESHASISKDGRKLYFTSNKRGGIGYVDIYVSELDENGQWGDPVNLGEDINTNLNEDTPFITEDGNTLYFSSQGYTSMGGFDVFVSRYTEGSGWSVPENLGYPLNSTDDDLFFYPWNNGEMGYMARMEEDGYGATDIYEIRFTPEIEEPVAVVEEVVPVEPEVQPVPEEMETPEVVTVPAVAPAKTVVISPVLFGFDKSTITDEGKQVLEQVAQTMKEFSDLTVILLGYADALGPADYNLRLTEQRAISVMNYLISKGIDAERLKAVGKGETDFIAPNTNEDGSDNPEGRKFNRRVEFEISGVDNNTLIIRRNNPVPEKLISK